jgi:hypothetical protein
MENEVVAPDTIDTPAPETPAPAPVEAPAEPQSRADTIREALTKTPTNRGKHAATQPREGGKFAPKFPTDQTQAPQMAEKPRAEMPKSLRLELKEHWEKAPVELQQAFAQRDADYEKGISQYKQRDAEVRAITEQFAPYEWILRNEGSTPAQAIGPLLQTAALLRTGTPQQKSQAVAQMIQQFQIPLEQVAAYFGGEAPPQQDSHYNQLAQQVQQLTQHITQSQYESQKQNENRALSVIQQFAGDPANAHFEAVQDRMLSLLQAPQVLGDISNMSEREKLQLAYDTAVRLDPQLAQSLYAQQQQNYAAQNQVQKAKQAAVQVRGAPGGAVSGPVSQTDRRAVIANALRSANF